MSQLLKKSAINEEAANALHKKDLYPSVAHCAYYSCLQLIKHILLNVLQVPPGDLATSQSSTREGSHEIMINKMTRHLNKTGKDYKTFNSKIGQLKRLRVDSDYENIMIDYSKSEESILLCQRIRKILT